MENFPSADFDFIALKHVSVKRKKRRKRRERERENVTGTFHVFQFRPHLLPRTSCAATRATHVGEKEWRKREKAGLAGREYG